MNSRRVNNTTKALLLFSILLLLFLSACADMEAGITPGGSQDNDHGKDIINRNGIPTSDAFTYEGSFSEHDFFIETSNCENTICIETVLTSYKPINAESNKYMAQLLMSSNITKENFKHKAVELMIILDKSGSMSGERFENSKNAIINIINKLTPEDSFGLITFDDSYDVELDLEKVLNKAALIRKVKQLRTEGATNIESALKKGYSILDNKGELSNRRIILLTDAQPNVGATGEGSFVSIIKDYENKIGLTVFGIGINFNQALVKTISETKGGNYIYLSENSEINTKLDENFEFLISPIANDFHIGIKSEDKFKITNVYGLPEINGNEITLDAKTLFLSKSKGAIAIEFEYHGENTNDIIPMLNDNIFNFDWSYTKVDGVKVTKSESIVFSPFYTTTSNYSYNLDGAQKLPLLVNLITALKLSLDKFHNEEDIDGSILILKNILKDLKDVNLILEDEQINSEIILVEKLIQNMESRKN